MRVWARSTSTPTWGAISTFAPISTNRLTTIDATCIVTYMNNTKTDPNKEASAEVCSTCLSQIISESAWKGIPVYVDGYSDGQLFPEPCEVCFDKSNAVVYFTWRYSS